MKSIIIIFLLLICNKAHSQTTGSANIGCTIVVVDSLGNIVSSSSSKMLKEDTAPISKTDQENRIFYHQFFVVKTHYSIFNKKAKFR